ncbi:unnamed protein product [Gordionus sp. m RMFG-2023]|uniref:uncharacterized protein LOC135927598 isoform X2 n=1 Tax=Gordionus sp. m RMFG-2023 TaxID=3053472 RepID=UPI0030E5A3EC
MYKFILLELFQLYLALLYCKCDSETQQVNLDLEKLLVKIINPAIAIDNLFTITNDFKFNDKNPRNLTYYISEECRADLNLYLNGIQHSKIWALHMVHSSGKYPSHSIYEGNFNSLGSFDRCLLPLHSLISPSLGYSTMSTSYCVASIDISRFIFPDTRLYPESVINSLKTEAPISDSLPSLYFRLGLCLPSTCLPADVQLLVQSTINHYGKSLLRGAINMEQHTGLKELNVEQVWCTGHSYLNIPVALNKQGPIKFQNNIPVLINESGRVKAKIAHLHKIKRNDLFTGVIYFSLFALILLIAKFKDVGIINITHPPKISNADKICRLKIFLYSHLILILDAFSLDKNWAKISDVSNKEAFLQIHSNGSSNKNFMSIKKQPLNPGGILRNPTHNEKNNTAMIPTNTISHNANNRKYTDVIYGIRGLSMLHVVYAHTYLFSSFITMNIGEILGPRMLEDPTIIFLYSGFFAVDTFFFLSGYLYVVSTAPKIEYHKNTSSKSIRSKLIDMLKLCFSRYMRLVPVYVSILVFEIFLVPHLGTFTAGPPSFSLLNTQSYENCRKMWWTNLLFVNNIVGCRKMCGVWTWYLANDIQFHLVAPIIMGLVRRLSRINGKLFLWGLLVLSVVSTFLISYFNRYRPGIFPDDPQILNFFYDFYIKPHIRITPYLMGFILAYQLSSNEDVTIIKPKNDISTPTEPRDYTNVITCRKIKELTYKHKWACLTLTTVLSIKAVTFLIKEMRFFLESDPTRGPALIHAIINATGRVIWSLIIGAIIMCSYRHFKESPSEETDSKEAPTRLSYLSALALSLTFEIPFKNLTKIYLKN